MMALLRNVRANAGDGIGAPLRWSASSLAVALSLLISNANGQPPGRPQAVGVTHRGNEEGAFTVAYSPDGTMVAAGGLPPSIRIWNPQTGQPRRKLTGSQRITRSLSFSPDSSVLAAGSDDGIARLWDPRTGVLEQELPRLGGEIAVAFSRDSNVVAVGSTNEVKLWDRKRREWEQSIRVAGLQVLPSLAFSPDRWTIAIGDGAEVGLWSLRTKKLERTIRVGDWRVFAVDYSPDGRLLALALDKAIPVPGQNASRVVSQVQLYDTRKGGVVLTLPDTGPRVNTVAFSPDGKTLATGGSGDVVRELGRAYVPSELTVWDSRTGKRLVTYRGAPGDIRALAYSGDGKTLVICNGEDVVLLDAQTGTVKHTLRTRSLPDEPQDKK